jgi:hypothetical protein
MLAPYRTLLYAIPDQLHIRVTLNPADLGIAIGIMNIFLGHQRPLIMYRNISAPMVNKTALILLPFQMGCPRLVRNAIGATRQ